MPVDPNVPPNTIYFFPNTYWNSQESEVTVAFEEDIRQVINRHSAESISGTPDFLLAELLVGVLKVYNEIVTKRAEWRGEGVDPIDTKKKTFISPLSEKQRAALWQQIGVLYNYSPSSPEDCHQLEMIVSQIAEGSL